LRLGEQADPPAACLASSHGEVGGHGRRQLFGEMTSDGVAWREGAQRRTLDAAEIGGKRAAGVKAASGRWRSWARRVALEQPARL
jgi:hypothetical protein